MRTKLSKISGTSRRRVGFRCFGLAAASLLAATQLSAADYTDVRISVPGSVETWANGINARGDIVGLYVTPDGVTHGYLLRKGVYTTIDYPAAEALEARRINSRGDIAGVVHDVDGSHGFVLSGGQFTLFNWPGSGFTPAFGLNDAGDVVGLRDGGSGSFLRQDGKFRPAPIGAVRGVDYRLFDIQDNGRVLVGTAISNEGITGFISRRHEIEHVTYPDLPGACTAFRGINERGDIVGSVATDECFPPFGDARGFLLRDGEFTPIHFPGAQGSDAWDINDDGVIVGRYMDSANHIVGFKAKPNK